MERQFVIQEVEEWKDVKGNIVTVSEAITENELRYRQEKIQGDMNNDPNFRFTDSYWDRVRDTLLHGAPKPKDEWETWVQDFPSPLGDRVGPINDLYIDWDKWKDSVTHWFRKMPRGK